MFRSYLPDISTDDDHCVSRSVTIGRSQWTYDSDAEFLAACQRSMCDAAYSEEVSLTGRRDAKLGFAFLSCDTIHGVQVARVEVTASRPEVIAAVAGVFEKHADASRLMESRSEDQDEGDPFQVFIGHGHSPEWRELKDHLAEKHGVAIETYEVGARAGHAVRDVLQSMLKRSSMAFLVMTGDDEAGGNVRSRQNVVHEAGLFQGALGFERAIVLLERGVESFSNIDGIETIRFEKGNIQSTFGDVVATIRREFPSE